MPLTVIELTDTLSHVALDGQLTMMGVDRLTGQFYEHIINRAVDAVVDLSKVTFISSAGIGMLLDARKQLQRDGAKVIILGAQPAVEQTLITARLDKVFEMAPDMAAVKELFEK